MAWGIAAVRYMPVKSLKYGFSEMEGQVANNLPQCYSTSEIWKTKVYTMHTMHSFMYGATVTLSVIISECILPSVEISSLHYPLFSHMLLY